MTDATIAPAAPDRRPAFRPATFGDALRSEWTKFRSVRSTFWALTVTVVLGIALGALISAATAHSLQPWPGFGVMCLFVAIVYAIAWTLLDRRDA